MAKSAIPPDNFNTLKLPFIRKKGVFKRFYNAGNDPVFFNKSNLHRFNAPSGEFGVLYACEDEFDCFIETFGWLTGNKIITEEELRKKHIAEIKIKALLNLVDLTGSGLTKIGADNQICSGIDYHLSQLWSKAIWAHPVKHDGIFYRIRHDPAKKGIALYDREKIIKNISFTDKESLADDPAMMINILKKYQFVVIPAFD